MADDPPARADGPSEEAMEAALDLEQVSQLAQLGPERLRPLVETYVASATAQVEAIHAALDVGDCDTARRAAHTLRGSSLTFGARRVSLTAAAIESLAEAGQAGEASALRATLARQVAAATAALRAAAGGEPPSGQRA